MVSKEPDQHTSMKNTMLVFRGAQIFRQSVREGKGTKCSLNSVCWPFGGNDVGKDDQDDMSLSEYLQIITLIVVTLKTLGTIFLIQLHCLRASSAKKNSDQA